MKDEDLAAIQILSTEISKDIRQDDNITIIDSLKKESAQSIIENETNHIAIPPLIATTLSKSVRFSDAIETFQQGNWKISPIISQESSNFDYHLNENYFV